MYEDLKQREVEILLYIKKYIESKGYPPTVREICLDLNIKSTSTVHSSMERLEYKGYIKKDPTKPRAVVIVDNKDDDFILNKKKTIDIPVINSISNMESILSFENIKDTFPIPNTFGEGKNLFIFKFIGYSMKNAGILDGDYLIIEKKSTSSNGDKVLAIVNEQPIIKTFYRENDYYILKSENEEIEPIISKEVKIIGVVVGSFRAYI